MNLVAKEFVAAREDEQGVLGPDPIHRRGARADRGTDRQSLTTPNRPDATALRRALTMEPDEQRDRMRAMRASVAEFNVYQWAGRMLTDAARLRQRGTADGSPRRTCRHVPVRAVCETDAHAGPELRILTPSFRVHAATSLM